MSETTQTTTAQSTQRRSATAITVDNLLRRRLRVSNPRSARDIADGLRRTFTADSAAERREVAGQSIADVAPANLLPASPGPTGVELEQAQGDVDRDLRALIENNQLKDIEAELDGWSQAIRASIDDGLSAARLALDPRARDRAFGARRTLADYARMARLIGTMTPTLSQPYRRLAQSLDEIGAMMLVTAGEALAALGLGSGRALLPAPASELTARRDAVLAALRTLTGATENSFAQDTWSFGLFGLRESLQRLEAAGHSDLRALLDQNTLAQMMDDLVDRASTTTARSLRALGATAQVTVQRMQRLITVLNTLQQNTDPETPPVANFLIALQLFVDGFVAQTSGYRLLFVARPPLVFYGLYGIGGIDVATRRLLDVVALRGRLAEMLDCYLGCDCCGPENACQAMLDKLLYDTDRAIDLLIVGSNPNGDGEPEFRAAAYGALIRQFFIDDTGTDPAVPLRGCLSRACSPSTSQLGAVLTGIGQRLLEPLIGAGPITTPITPLMPLYPDQSEMMRSELCLQAHSEDRWENLVTAMAPSCTTWAAIHTPIAVLLSRAQLTLGAAGPCPDPQISMPPTIESGIAEIGSGRLTMGLPLFTPPEKRLLRSSFRVSRGFTP
ncbi:MAG TPA: hypothetical protein VH814_05170 [Steroidobacteraceae bacterium]|jgi:hypothetical protein